MILTEARECHVRGRWRLSLMLVMPDHLHFIVQVSDGGAHGAHGAHGAFSGDGAVVQRVPHGEAAIVPTVVSASGYRFTGWSADTSHVTGTLTATAQYEAILYAITYENLYGATHGNPSTYTVEDAVTFTAPGSIPRRQFVRWEPASIAVGSTGAVTVRAIWETTPCVYVDAGQGNDAWDGSGTDRAVKTLARVTTLPTSSPRHGLLLLVLYV